MAGGRTFGFKHFQPRATLTDEFLDDLAAKGRLVVSACGVNEVALETPEIGHGLFTYYVLKGLEGAADRDNDGRVTVSELYDYVYHNVSQHARRLGGSMHPIQKGFLQGTVYLTDYNATSASSAPFQKPGDVWLRERLNILDSGYSFEETMRVAQEIVDDGDSRALARVVRELYDRCRNIPDPRIQSWIVTAIGKAGTNEAIRVLHELSNENMHPLVTDAIQKAVNHA